MQFMYRKYEHENIHVHVHVMIFISHENFLPVLNTGAKILLV